MHFEAIEFHKTWSSGYRRSGAGEDQLTGAHAWAGNPKTKWPAYACAPAS